jgi:chemotaxis protein methyltransferase CheR
MLGYTDACMAIEALPLLDARLALLGRPGAVPALPAPLPPAPPKRLLAPEPPAPAPPPSLEEIRALADRGQLAEARAAAEERVKERSQDPAAHFHHALILMLLPGSDQAAAQAMRRALYLDGELAAGHYYQGLLRQRLGERRTARRSLETARHLAGQQQGDSPVKGWEEVTHEQLVGLAQSQLELLGPGGA